MQRSVTAHSDPDLCWALRGGGGDFGIVTAVEIDLFRAPELYGGRLLFPGSAAAQVLRAFVQLTRSAPDELTLWATILHFPDLPKLPPEVRGQSFTIIDAMFVGRADDAEALLAPVRAAGPVIREIVRPLRPSEVGGISEEPAEAGSPTVSVARPLTSLDPAVLEGLLAVAGPGTGTPLSVVQLRHLGGAVPVPALEGPVHAGIEALLGVIRTSVSPDALLTFLAPEDTIGDAYDAPTLDRLRAVKRAVDPGGVIRSNYPVLAG